MLQRRSGDLEFWARRIRTLVAEETQAARRARQDILIVALNIMIVGALLLGAEVLIRFLESAATETFVLGPSLAIGIGCAALLLSVAPIIAIWRGLRGFLGAAIQRVAQQDGSPLLLHQRTIMNTLPVATATGITVIIVFEALPLFLHLLPMAHPLQMVPFAIVAAVVALLAWDSLGQVHKKIEGFLALRDTPYAAEQESTGKNE